MLAVDTNAAQLSLCILDLAHDLFEPRVPGCNILRCAGAYTSASSSRLSACALIHQHRMLQRTVRNLKQLQMHRWPSLMPHVEPTDMSPTLLSSCLATHV